MKKILLSVFVVGLLAINVVVVSNNVDSNTFLNLSSLLNQAFADTEDPPSECVPPCSPGFSCVGGVCVQREAAIRTSCTTLVLCWLQLKYVSAPGHQTTCPVNPGGITNCMGTACEADVDPC